ncbi:hypothetical protein [Pseudonocardia alaniniphila]|nr:hypothetical protein [Pseudonocardia alaniniphila]
MPAPSALVQSSHNEMRWIKVRGCWLLRGSFLPPDVPSDEHLDCR